jgi:PAS domain S-box-containing protein
MPFQFPEDLAQAIELLSQETGMDKADLTVEVLSQALEVVPFSSKTATAAFLALSAYCRGELSDWLLRSAGGGSTLTAGMSQSARTLDQILSAFPDLVFVQDREGRFVYVNLETTKVLGFERSFFIGKTFQDLDLPIEVLKKLAAQRESVYASGRSVRGEVSIPITAQSARDYEYIFSPVHGPGNQVETVVFAARDITARKQTAIALRESEERYRCLFEAADDSIFIVDASTHRILDANWSAARLLGYTRRELLQMSIWDVAELTAANDRAAVLQKLENDGESTFEFIYRLRDGTEIFVEARVQAIEYGDRLALQGFVRDISDRKRAEAELRALNSQLEQRVLERTAELSRANQELTSAIAALEQRAANLEASNQALRDSLSTMQTTEEELRTQNDELIAARQSIEMERQHDQDWFNFTPDGYLITDRAGVIQKANLAIAQLLGVDQLFLVGKPLDGFVARQDLAQFQMQLQQVNQQAEPQICKLHLQSAATAPLFVEVKAGAMRDRQGETVRLQWLIRG